MSLMHLLPSVQPISALSPQERMDWLKTDRWIGYTQAEEALSKLEDLFKHPKRVRMPNMLIVGPTNNGKTMIVEKFKRQHLPYEPRNQNHIVVPVLMIQMPSDPTIKRFYATIASELGSPITGSGANLLVHQERTALKFLKITQTRVLIIDEIHNILAGALNKQREFLNVLRCLGNSLQISIVGVGVKEAYLAIRSDDQLENRFAPLILPLWRDGHEFRRLLASFQSVLPLQRPSNLQEDKVRSFILQKTEGTIGEVVAFLTKATETAILSGKEHIDYATLEQADYQSPMERRRLYESMLS